MLAILSRAQEVNGIMLHCSAHVVKDRVALIYSCSFRTENLVPD